MKWQPIETAPISTPIEQKYFLGYFPEDPWGVGGCVHFAIRYSDDSFRPMGTLKGRKCTRWMPIPEPPQ